ncbi:sulfotransferase [Nonomuraea fastidiosa]|uniref:sulfotransferase n=1 Tax=Nonomuraea TaxID=83681 RepID=UPI00341D84BD
MNRLKFDSILVVTYGRSGSTLLQGILNTIDGCLIRGENDNLCYGLFQAYQSVLTCKRQAPYNRTVRDPWWGCDFDEGTFFSASRSLVERLLLAGSAPGSVCCYGFKEIRYDEFDRATLFRYLGFLERLFPNPALIFNTREHRDVMASAWWRDLDPGTARLRLARAEENFRAYAAAKPNCFMIDYRDTSQASPRLRELFAFLGADYSAAAIGRVLGIRHSYRPAQERIRQLPAYR